MYMHDVKRQNSLLGNFLMDPNPILDILKQNFSSVRPDSEW